MYNEAVWGGVAQQISALQQVLNIPTTLTFYRYKTEVDRAYILFKRILLIYVPCYPAH